MTVIVLPGDCRTLIAGMADASIDAIVTDPPYELGFMGKSWDAAGVAYDVELWREALRVLKPGGHLLAFGGTRTYHRMTVAIEDAGFEIRDSIHWLYGSGFPKSLDVSKAIDKMLGAKREVVGSRTLSGTAASTNPATETLDGSSGIGVDMSADYCRLAEWRTNGPGYEVIERKVHERTYGKVARKQAPKPTEPDEPTLFGDTAA